MSKRVIVVGGGNAALCAALSARENGADVVVLERAEGELKGGNTAFTAGAMRVAYDGVDDLLTLMPELTDEELANTDFGSYSASDFFDDLARVTEYRTDPELASVLADESLPTLQWMSKQGVRFVPIYGRQAFKIDGRFKFWGGLTVEVSGGGPGLVDALTKAAANAGVQVEYGARVLSLIAGDDGVSGVIVRQHGGDPRGARRRGDPRQWRLPGEHRVADAVPRPELGPRQGARHPVQHRRRSPDGAQHRGQPGRQLVRLPRRRAGSSTLPSSATWPWATTSRSTATRGRSWSTPTGEAVRRRGR